MSEYSFKLSPNLAGLLLEVEVARGDVLLLPPEKPDRDDTGYDYPTSQDTKIIAYFLYYTGFRDAG